MVEYRLYSKYRFDKIILMVKNGTEKLSVYLVLMVFSDCEIPAQLFLILWPSSQITRSGPGFTKAVFKPATLHNARIACYPTGRLETP